MYQFKTWILFIGLTLACSSVFAYDNVNDCFISTMKEEGIANMQNRYNSNTIAGKAAIKIWNFCNGLFKRTSSTSEPLDKEKLETLECTPETCPPIETENTTIEI